MTADAVHLTSAHLPHDVRIHGKECATLTAAGYQVVLLAAPLTATAGGLDPVTGVVVETVASPRTRRHRMMVTPWRLLAAARRHRASAYHVHDPELLGIGLLLKLGGHRLIYDAHEDLPAQMLSKQWIPGPLRWPVAKLVDLIERGAARCADQVIAATPSVARRFPPGRTTVIQNLPRAAELHRADARPLQERPLQAIYVGNVTEVRGIRQLVAAAELLPDGVSVVVAGRIDPPGLLDELERTPGFGRVRLLGVVSRREVATLFAESRVGLLPFLPVPNHIDSLPTKLFEYMSAGLPVVAADLPAIRDVIERTGCGILVDARSPQQIAAAISHLLASPDEAAEMGARGRAAVEAGYNWTAEGDRLVTAYHALIGPPRPDVIPVLAVSSPRSC